jgi:hypothetical protein
VNCFLNAEDRSKGIAPGTRSEQLFDYAGIEESPKYLTHTANVLLLGSSLFLHPEWSVDRTIPITEPWGKTTIISESHYHLAQGLENELAKEGFEPPHVYNLAAGGALISDAYLLLFHYLHRHHKPSVVVLDCAPRSFNDTGVNEPAATPVFDCCFQIQDFAELHKDYLKDTNAKANYVLSKVFFLYHHRKWLSESAQECLVQPIIDAAQVTQSKTPTKIAQQRAKLSVPNRMEQVPTRETTKESLRMANSLQEYKDRYKWMTRYALGPQLRFLERIEELCADKQIKLIIVNMPLSKENRKLLLEGFYDSYRADVAKTVRSPAVFIDLALSEDWPASCYHDSVHLNERGGARLNKVIANAIMQGAWQAHSDTTQSQ